MTSTELVAATSAQLRTRTHLLDYAVLTEPRTVTADSTATVDILISNSGASPVHCKQITVNLRAGAGAAQLAATGGGLTGLAQLADPASGIKCEVHAFGGTGGSVATNSWTVATVADTDAQSVVFTATPAGGQSTDITGGAILLRLKNVKINAAEGISPIEVRASITPQGTGNWRDETSFLRVAKYDRQVAPARQAAQLIQGFWAGPTTGKPDIANGTAVALHWDGPSAEKFGLASSPDENANNYLFYEVWDNGWKASTAAGTYAPTPPLKPTRTTTYILRLTIRRNGQRPPEEHYATTTVSVSDPTYTVAAFDEMNVSAHGKGLICNAKAHFNGGVSMFGRQEPTYELWNNESGNTWKLKASCDGFIGIQTVRQADAHASATTTPVTATLKFNGHTRRYTATVSKRIVHVMERWPIRKDEEIELILTHERSGRHSQEAHTAGVTLEWIPFGRIGNPLAPSSTRT